MKFLTNPSSTFCVAAQRAISDGHKGEVSIRAWSPPAASVTLRSKKLFIPLTNPRLSFLASVAQVASTTAWPASPLPLGSPGLHPLPSSVQSMPVPMQEAGSAPSAPPFTYHPAVPKLSPAGCSEHFYKVLQTLLNTTRTLLLALISPGFPDVSRIVPQNSQNSLDKCDKCSSYSYRKKFSLSGECLKAPFQCGKDQPGLVPTPRGKPVSFISFFHFIQSGVSLEVKCFHFTLKCQQKLILIGSCRHFSDNPFKQFRRFLSTRGLI